MDRLHALLLLSLTLLCVPGCSIPFPLPHPKENHWEGVVGGADSSAPLKTGLGRRYDVYQKLGERHNDYRWPTGPRTSWRYLHRVQTGFTAIDWPLHSAGFVNPIYRLDWVAIWFGTEGRIEQVEIWSECPGKSNTPTPRAAAEEEDFNRRAAKNAGEPADPTDGRG